MSAPTSGVRVLAAAAVSAVGMLAVGAVVLRGMWIGVQGAVLRLNTIRWGREWDQVEPRWSGRVP